MQTAEPLRPRDMSRRIAAPARPRAWRDLRFKPQPPVRWFSPGVLTSAGLRLLVSSAFGSYLDKRELQGALPADSFAHRAQDEELWFDFLADTGDGFGPTYTMAWLASRPELEVRGMPKPLPRGSLLVLGGDEVYPSGSPQAYEDRFVGPFRAALPWSDDPPDLLALAGNHDWYDGLSSFVRLFCQGRWVGARRTRQSRSYFAVLLPHRWWMWGIDIQFDAYLDDPQIKYFERVLTEEMEPGDRLILCTGKPSWTDLQENPEACRNLAYLERLIRSKPGIELLVTLTGDMHAYARYEGADGSQKIAAGGGGAFLHPTHDLPEDFTFDIDKDGVDPEHYRLETTYPKRGRSRFLSLGAVALPLRNPSFMVIPAVVYLLLAWASQFGIRALDDASSQPLHEVAPGFSLGDLALGLVRNPNSVVLALVFLIGLVSFAKPPGRFAHGRSGLAAKMLMGAVHATMHLVAYLLVNLVAFDLASFATGGWFTVLAFLFTALLGGVAGGVVMGIYLAVSIATPGWEAHGNEAFSALRLTCAKNFLRLHIDADGALHVYPIGLDRAVLRWQLDPDNPDVGAPWLAPVGPDPAPHLIETPIVIDGRRPGPVGLRG